MTSHKPLVSKVILHLLLILLTRHEIKVLIISHERRQGDCYRCEPEHAQHHQSAQCHFCSNDEGRSKVRQRKDEA